MHLPPYPDFSQFGEAAGTVINRLRGDTTIEKEHVVHCCYVVVGFGLSVALPCPDEAMATGPVVTCATPDDVANCLEMAANAGPGYKNVNLDWRSLVSILLTVLQQWLSN